MGSTPGLREAPVACVLTLFLATLPAGKGQAQGSEPRRLAGGPNDVEQIIESNDTQRRPAFALPGLDNAISPWLDFRQGLAEDYGFQLGTDYQMLVQEASDSLGEDQAAGGAYRLFFNWTVTGRGTDNTGGLVFKTEHRHNLWEDVAPEGLGGELGYAGLTGTGYGDFNWGVTDLFWKQRWMGGNGVELRVGRLAPTAYFDGTLHSDPYKNFVNFSLNFTPTVAYPADGSLGTVLWVGVTENFYVQGTVLDANSDTTESGFDSIDEEEFFYGLEFGWADRGAASSFVDNVHITLWESDERDDAGVPSSWGAGLTASWLFGDDRWSPFIRLGHSDGDASILENSVAAGIGYNLTSRDDLFGFGASWGEAPNAENDDQYTAEVFYRLQLARNLAITLDLQYLENPAYNTEDDSIWVFGTRTRITF